MIGPPQTASEGDDLWVWLSRHFVPLSSHCTHISVCNSVWLYILLLFWCHSIIIIDLAGTVQRRILMSGRLFSNRFHGGLSESNSSRVSCFFFTGTPPKSSKYKRVDLCKVRLSESNSSMVTLYVVLANLFHCSSHPLGDVDFFDKDFWSTNFEPGRVAFHWRCIFYVSQSPVW